MKEKKWSFDTITLDPCEFSEKQKNGQYLCTKKGTYPSVLNCYNCRPNAIKIQKGNKKGSKKKVKESVKKGVKTSENGKKGKKKKRKKGLDVFFQK